MKLDSDTFFGRPSNQAEQPGRKEELSAFARTLGKRIQHFRTLRQLSQQALARVLGVTRQTVGKYECGKIIVPTEKIPVLCVALMMTPNELFG